MSPWLVHRCGPTQQGTSTLYDIKEQEARHREMAHITRHTCYSFIPGEKNPPPSWQKYFTLEGQKKQNEKSIYFGSSIRKLYPRRCSHFLSYYK